MSFARFRPLGLLALMLVAVACADSAPGKKNFTDAAVEDGDGMNINVPDVPGTTPPTAAPTGAPEPGTATLQVVDPRPRTMPRNSTLDVAVRYFDTNAQPAANITVQAAMIDANSGADLTAAGLQGTLLGGSDAITNASGDAVFTVNSGNSGNVVVIFDLRFSGPGVAEEAEPKVRVSVVPVQAGPGELEVKVIYVPRGRPNGGRYTFGELTQARVSLFNGKTCEQVLAENNASEQRLPPAELQLPLQPFDSASNVVSAERPGGNNYSVIAQATNAAGTVLAFGCKSAVTIVGGEKTHVDLPLKDLPLLFKGEFQVISRFDLTDMLVNSGVEGMDIVDQVLGVLGAIGHVDGSGEGVIALVDLVCNDLLHLDESVCSVAETAVSTLGADTIEDLILDYVPDQVLQVMTIIGDVYSILSEFTVVGTITLNPTEGSVDILQCQNTWEEMTFEWRDGCEAPPPDDPAQDLCTRTIPFGAQGGDPPIEAIIPAAAVCDPSAQVRPESCPPEVTGLQIVFPDHSFSVHYGLIIMSVAEQWIIPALTGMDADTDGDGRVSIAELLNSFEICANFGSGEDFCERVLIGALSNVITNQLGNLGADINQFILNGVADPKDTDADLSVDRLDNGVWNARVDVGSGTGFHGCFSGCLRVRGEDNRFIDCPDLMDPCEIPDPVEPE